MGRRENGDREWIEGTLELAVEIAAARSEYRGDRNFGSWLIENALGENYLPKDERSILIQWGENPDWTRTVLEKTERRSVQTIHRNEWSVRSATKPSTKPPGGAKLHKAKAFAQAYEAETGRLPTERLTAREAGVSQGVSADALRDLKSRRAEEDGRIRFLKAQDHHVEARVRILDKKRETEFNERVRLAMLAHNQEYRRGLEELQKEASEKLDLYEKLVNRHKPLFTVEEYKNLLMVAHPDSNPSKDVRNAAFLSLKAAELQLIGRKL
jgi:hypothetical protein